MILQFLDAPDVGITLFVSKEVTAGQQNWFHSPQFVSFCNIFSRKQGLYHGQRKISFKHAKWVNYMLLPTAG